MTIFRIIFGVFATLGGASALLGVWFPSVRGVWGGPFTGGPPKDYRDRVGAGAVTSAGFGLLFITLGLASLLGNAIPKRFGIVGLVCVIAAFFLIIGGWLLDSRAHEAERGAYRLPGEPRSGTPDERQRWILAACGALILGTMILVLIFHG